MILIKVLFALAIAHRLITEYEHAELGIIDGDNS